jgi:hypothetical protein
MPYARQIPVEVFLHRYWDMPVVIVDKICEGLPRTHHGSYLNVYWNSVSVICSLPWHEDPRNVLRTALWMRFYGPLECDPDAKSIRWLAETCTVVTEHVLIFKAVRLAIAVMRVGINPHNISCPPVSTVDNNMELFRLLCQGPLPQREAFTHVDLGVQMTLCFKILVHEARQDGNVNVEGDLRILQIVFEAAYSELDLGSWFYDVNEDIELEPDRDAPRMSHLVLTFA